MTDIQTESFPTPDGKRVLAVKIGKELLQGEKYWNLSEHDLKNQGLIPKNQDFTDFMVGRLGFNESIESEAFMNLTAYVPPPSDTDVVYNAKANSVITSQAEEQLRRSALGEENHAYGLIREQSGKDAFVAKIIKAAGVINYDGEKSFDPEKLKDDKSLSLALLNQEPTIVNFDNKYYFAVKVPKEKSGGFAGVLFAMTSEVGDTIVVADPDKNSELSDYLFSDKNLFRYFLAQNIMQVQRRKYETVSGEIKYAASVKYKNAEQEVEKINSPVQRHFFDLLLKDASGREITLFDVLRDHKDLEVTKGNLPQDHDRRGSESGSRAYTITSLEPGILSVQYQTVDYRWEKQGDQTVQVITPMTQSIYVRINKDDKFEFRVATPGKENEWNDGSGYNGLQYNVQHLFTDIVAVSSKDVIEHGVKIKPEVPYLEGKLKNSKSATEFLTVLKDHGLSGYPMHELILNTDPSVKYAIGVFPQPASTDQN